MAEIAKNSDFAPFRAVPSIIYILLLSARSPGPKFKTVPLPIQELTSAGPCLKFFAERKPASLGPDVLPLVSFFFEAQILRIGWILT
jgi:hypothetical protein